MCCVFDKASCYLRLAWLSIPEVWNLCIRECAYMSGLVQCCMVTTVKSSPVLRSETDFSVIGRLWLSVLEVWLCSAPPSTWLEEDTSETEVTVV